MMQIAANALWLNPLSLWKEKIHENSIAENVIRSDFGVNRPNPIRFCTSFDKNEIQYFERQLCSNNVDFIRIQK